MSDTLAKYQPQVAVTPAEAKATLIATRDRTRTQFAALEAELLAVVSWREVVRRYPVATLVGAFAVGLAVSQLWRRRPKGL
jgi:hypothetical protein